MLSESLEFYGKGSRAMLSIGLARVYQHIQAIGHRWLYQATPSPKNVVVLGGSYAGIHLAQRLTETLPTGYRAVLIKSEIFNPLSSEANSRFIHFRWINPTRAQRHREIPAGQKAII